MPLMATSGASDGGLHGTALLAHRPDAGPTTYPNGTDQIGRELQSKGAVRKGRLAGRQYEGLNGLLEMLRGFGVRWIVDGSPTLNKEAVAATRWLDG